jgi:hypothetical protein
MTTGRGELALAGKTIGGRTRGVYNGIFTLIDVEITRGTNERLLPEIVK